MQHYHWPTSFRLKPNVYFYTLLLPQHPLLLSGHCDSPFQSVLHHFPIFSHPHLFSHLFPPHQCGYSFSTESSFQTQNPSVRQPPRKSKEKSSASFLFWLNNRWCTSTVPWIQPQFSAWNPAWWQSERGSCRGNTLRSLPLNSWNLLHPSRNPEIYPDWNTQPAQNPHEMRYITSSQISSCFARRLIDQRSAMPIKLCLLCSISID